MIIRHPLQDIKEFIRVYDQCRNGDSVIKFINDHIDLFNSSEFVYKFCQNDKSKYPLIPDKFKNNKKLISMLISYYYVDFNDIPDHLKNDRQFVIDLFKNEVESSLFIYDFLSDTLKKDPEIAALQIYTCRGEYGLYEVISCISKDLINDRNFILSLEFDYADDSLDLYNYLSIELKRDYDILLKHGYGCILTTTYNRIMTPEMKSDVELHRKLINLNPKIYDLMSEELKNIIPKN
jgi:hypothetical protein